MVTPHDPQSEAQATLGDGGQAVVLEPSPPAVTVEPFADDPLAPAADGGDGTVLPFADAAGSATTWQRIVTDRPDLASFAEANWLGPWRRLGALPDTFGATRLSLHRLGAYVLSPARRRANTKIGLRYTRDGFGTPFFVDPADGTTSMQLRVVGTDVIVQRGDTVDTVPITTLNAAAAALDSTPDVEWAAQFDIPGPGPLDETLPVDAAAAAALADWFGLAHSALEELRADEASVDASNPQLWPEHFDPAIEVGADAAKHRGSFGFSPGDAEGGESEPYVYVSAWYPESLGDDAFWNSTTYPGAILRYQELLAADDQRATALAFLRRGRDLLATA
ncbi:MAG: hypothetical protein AAF962_23655 [Actinomycetota bacterium]